MIGTFTSFIYAISAVGHVATFIGPNSRPESCHSDGDNKSMVYTAARFDPGIQCAAEALHKAHRENERKPEYGRNVPGVENQPAEATQEFLSESGFGLALVGTSIRWDLRRLALLRRG